MEVVAEPDEPPVTWEMLNPGNESNPAEEPILNWLRQDTDREARLFRLAGHAEHALAEGKVAGQRLPDHMTTTTDPTDPGIEELPWNLCEMEGEDRQRMADVIRKHKAMFNSKKHKRLGKINGIEFIVDTGDCPPVRESCRRLHP